MPDEKQRVQLATILLFAGSRSAELVDTSLSAKDKQKIKDTFWHQETPWEDPNDSNYDADDVDPLEQVKSLCWEDIKL